MPDTISSLMNLKSSSQEDATQDNKIESEIEEIRLMK